MIELIAPAEWIFSGLCLYACVNHLYRATRGHKSSAHLSLSGMALAGFAYGVTTVSAFHARSVADWVWATHLQFVLATIVFSLFALFAAQYAEIRGRRGLFILIAFNSASVILSMTQRWGLFTANTGGLVQTALPWGETIPVPTGGIAAPQLFFYLLPAYMSFIYVFWGCRRLMRQGERFAGNVLTIATAVALAGVALNDFNTFFSFSPVMFPEFGFLAIIVIMSANLSSSLVEGHYLAFVSGSTAIARVEFDEPVPLSLPLEEQIRLILERSYIAECNEIFARQRRSTVREITGRRVLDLTVASDPRNQEAFIAIASSKYQIRDVETHGRDTAGIDRYYRTSIYGMRDKGSLVRLWLTQEEITDRRSAEMRAIESSERFARLCEASFDGTGISENGVLIDANEQLARMLGYSLPELIGRPVAELVAPQSKELVEKSMRAGQEGIYEHVAMRKDGSAFPVEVRARMIQQGERLVRVSAVRDITSRIETQRVLAESEERYRQLVNHANDVIFITNATGHFTFINPIATRMLGYSIEELMGMHFLNLIRPDVRERAERFYRVQAARKTLNTYYEFPIQIKDGRELWIGQNVRSEIKDGKAAGFHAVARNITRRKQAEEELQRSEERFRLVAEQTGQLIYDRDIATDSIRWAGAIKSLTGYEFGEFQEFGTGDWENLVHSADRLDLVASLDRAQKTGQPFHAEYWMRTKRGAYVLVEDNGVFLKNRAGVYSRMLGTIKDITARRQAEDAMKTIARGVYGATGDAFFKTLVENVALVLTADIAFVAVRTREDQQNIQTIAVWTDGHPGEHFSYELAGTPCGDVVQGQFCAFPNSVQRQFPLDRRLAELKIEGYAGIPLIDDAGSSVGLIAVLFRSSMTNIRLAESALQIAASRAAAELGWKKAEAEILQLNLDLERRVEQRTKELRAVNRELEAFSYSVSHDLRAPLRNISGFADLLKNNAADLNVQSAGYLSTISKEVKRMGTLIDDLLEFSHVSRREISMTTFDPAELVEDVRKLLEIETRDRKVSWHVEQLPAVKADRGLLRQVFANLMGNSVKYTTPREHAFIHIGSLPERPEANEVVFFVQDNGVGFDMKYVDKLFGVFQRLHSAKQFGGSGIGLANVQRIINRHGGRVWADGSVDAGATFYFSLPSGGQRKGEVAGPRA